MCCTYIINNLEKNNSFKFKCQFLNRFFKKRDSWIERDEGDRKRVRERREERVRERERGRGTERMREN